MGRCRRAKPAVSGGGVSERQEYSFGDIFCTHVRTHTGTGWPEVLRGTYVHASCLLACLRLATCYVLPEIFARGYILHPLTHHLPRHPPTATNFTRLYFLPSCHLCLCTCQGRVSLVCVRYLCTFDVFWGIVRIHTHTPMYGRTGSTREVLQTPYVFTFF